MKKVFNKNIYFISCKLIFGKKGAYEHYKNYLEQKNVVLHLGLMNAMAKKLKMVELMFIILVMVGVLR